MDDATLVEALRAAGHQETADHLRDSHLAKQLRDAGHADVADALEGKRTGQPSIPAPPEDPNVVTARAMLDEVNRLEAGQWVDGGGLPENVR